MRGPFFLVAVMNVVELLKQHEGYSRSVYRCSSNRQTIGYGRNLDDVGISREEAEWLLKRDIDNAVAFLRNEPYWLDLNEVRQAVLIDMSVNLGWPRFSAFKKMRSALILANYKLAAAEMLDSRWAEQVKNRAKRLSEMMASGEWKT